MLCGGGGENDRCGARHSVMTGTVCYGVASVEW